jgi:outer membrane lipoprotein-sorting protein
MTANKNAPSRSKSWLWIAVSAFLIALLALAAACSSSDDEDVDDGGNDSPTATADANGDGDSNGDDNGDGDGDNNGDDGDGDSLADRLRDLSDDYEIVEAKVVFDFTSTGGGEDEDFDTQMTLISRPPSDTRMEFSTDEGTVIVISTSDASYTCFSGGGEESCFELPVGDSDPNGLPFFGDFTDVDEIRDIVDAEADVDIDEFDDNIAGEDVNCFRATGNVDGDDGETVWCFTDDGILLFSSFNGTVGGVDSTFEMRATSFDRDVSDSDFEPPYDILDLGDLGDLGDLFD